MRTQIFESTNSPKRLTHNHTAWVITHQHWTVFQHTATRDFQHTTQDTRQSKHHTTHSADQ